ncbi:hypothetical protein CYY_005189, partial [Polysphondylium violaceum]
KSQKILQQAEEQKKLNLFMKYNVLERDVNQVNETVILNRNCTHIDIVYTWVNGSDPRFVNKRKEAGFDVKRDIERYRDFGALKYSLRSIKKFAPWAKNIWILTDSQIPDFFDFDSTAESNIKFIFHESFFKNLTHLPTFSSVSIESNFYNLPEEVSNCFLYFNDDVILKSPVQQSDFFDANYNQVIFEVNDPIGLKIYRKFNQLDPYYQSIVLSSQLLDSKWNDKQDRFKNDHGIQVFDRKVLLQMYKEIGEEMDIASSHNTRVSTDPQLAFIYNQFVKRYVPLFKAVRGFNFYGGITTNFAQVRVALQDAYKTNAKALCFNDGLNGQSRYYKDVLYELINFYDSLVPEPAPWEKVVKSRYVE